MCLVQGPFPHGGISPFATKRAGDWYFIRGSVGSHGEALFLRDLKWLNHGGKDRAGSPGCPG